MKEEEGQEEDEVFSDDDFKRATLRQLEEEETVQDIIAKIEQEREHQHIQFNMFIGLVWGVALQPRKAPSIQGPGQPRPAAGFQPAGSCRQLQVSFKSASGQLQASS